MLWGLIAVLCVIIIVQFIHIHNSQKQIREILNILDDICAGNLDRRVLAKENRMLRELAYQINDIVICSKEKFLEKDRSEKAYKKFATSLSHDVRTPLVSLIGYLEALEDSTLTGEEQERFLRIAKTKALDLNEYIQQLFEWFKLESGEWVYELKKQDICELTRLILADWVVKLEGNKIGFDFEIPEGTISILMDQNALSRLLNNLLSNIINHSYATQISIRLSDSAEKLELSISDNGVGIAEKDLPFLFDRLYQCGKSRTENSNGLGLAIAKELVNALNGEIYVESSVGRGTTFRLNFPKSIEKA